ncbi:cytochrome P450 2F2 isoform X2 [Microcaecilia unicolor]|uniref:Cytochrome P450 2F2-like isoform X2 n=1 Tax=Microcaecilia unicolor TaxID=1415580 RepID=A0A6P7ZGB4_9AMPH|nr:cytochrome P450 2F2-like isoform X2 [Microcaecilia unicolor]
MDFNVVLILLLIACISYLIMVYAKMLQKRGQLPPGPVPLPIVGNLLQVNSDNFAQSLIAMSKKYGPVFTLYMGSQPNLVLCGYETIKEALISQGDQFVGRGPCPFFENFTKGNESPVDPTLIFCRSVSNVICSVLFGSRFDYEDKTFQTIVSTTNENFKIMSSSWGMLYNIYSDVLQYLPGPHKKLFGNYETLRAILQDSIKAHQKTLDPNNPRDYIDVFLIKMEQEKNNPTSHYFMESLIMTMHNLIYGGTDTVTTFLRYSVLVLMKFPEVAEKIQEEINQVIGQTRPPATEDRKMMPYTDAVIQELQRFTDIGPLAIVHLVMQDTQLHGYKIPKGLPVIPVITSVHYDPTQYEKPEDFNPANFLDQNGCFKKNDAVMVFSAGKRICPGENLARMEIFLFLTTLLQNFTFQPLGNREDIDLSPTGGTLENLPHSYQCCAIPR